NGKLDRAALRTATVRGGDAGRLPRTATEQTLQRIWSSVLGVECGIDDDFFDLGGQSLVAVRLVAAVEEAFGQRLPLAAVFREPTIAAMAALLEGERPGSVEHDVMVDVVLPDDVRWDGAPARAGAPREVLLTGATGFVGSFLLAELLARPGVHVHCLVRADDAASATRKLRDALASRELSLDGFDERVHVVVGDLDAPRLGLDGATYATLAERVDAILHDGANVNAMLPYGRLRRTNVLGTVEILRLAATTRVKRVHFVSTISVFGGAHAGRVIRETDAPLNGAGLTSGYARSKWAAERLVEEAARRNVPTTILRAGSVSGHRRTGVCNHADLLHLLLRGCITLGAAPDVMHTINLTPVDAVSAAIVDIALDPAGAEGPYHLVRAAEPTVRELVRFARARGIELRLIPHPTWVDRLREAVERTGDATLMRLQAVLDVRSGESDRATRIAWSPWRYECTRAELAAPRFAAQMDVSNEALFDVYLNYLVRSGLLKLNGASVMSTSSRGGEMHATDDRRARHVADLVKRFTTKTAKSKASAAAHRVALANRNFLTRFRPDLKEMVYPIVGASARGARVWDIDGNEYVDLSMGFGVNLFGHEPAFVKEALTGQLARGIQLGPHSEIAGECAERVCRMTGHERAFFANSGTEAVMIALRLARVATGRDKIAVFKGSYHGHSDATLVGAVGDPPGCVSRPGVGGGVARDVLLLNYDDPRSLELIEKETNLAGVIVEPVQADRPTLRPRAFLEELRALTARKGAALIFDEMITGFRLHPAGVQGLFGIRADLATYGKVIGGGMPTGVVAGSSAFMNGVDGGPWAFGDDSAPSALPTFVAGTYCKHPLAMAAMSAVLDHLEAAGPALQERLNERSDAFVGELNALAASTGAPLVAENYGSLLGLYLRPAPYSALFEYHMFERGIFMGVRGGFLSTAHSDADLRTIVDAVKATLEDMARGDVL
ncbi:MAG TPA: thioester reductase domain-containing protein, partial [Minicystis sp.]|nr:thioester reductase domain-containing protein [Minicystis sp.]